MRDLIPADWSEQLGLAIRSEEIDRLADVVARQRNDHPGRIYPPASEVFTALDLTPYKDVRAVILGMDPYAGFGQAHSLAFSLRPSATAFPPSLQHPQRA
jgi:uracil-DNA glycosylase